MADPRSGVRDDGEWSPAFPGQRPPFEPGNEHRVEPGNELAVKHGSYVAAARLGNEVEHEAAAIRDHVPAYSEADDGAIVELAIVRVRIARAQAALAKVDEATSADSLGPYRTDSEVGVAIESLKRDLSRWLTHARRFEDALGLSPAARGRLGVDLSLAARNAALLANQRRALLERGAELVEAGAAEEVDDGD